MRAKEIWELDKVCSLPAETLQNLDRQSIQGMASLHRSAFPGSLLSRLGSGVVSRYYVWQLEGPHDIDAAGIFRDGELSAFCIGGVFRGAMSGFIRKNLTVLACAVLRHQSKTS